jgi:hypothetical protein
MQRRIKLNLLLQKLKTTSFYLQSTGDFTGDFEAIDDGARAVSWGYCAHLRELCNRLLHD